MNFSQALEQLKAGHRVQRAGWNGKGMFLYHVPGSTFLVNRPPLLGIYPLGTEVKYHAHIDMKTADGQCVPWLCSQTDMLADDWSVVGAAGIEEETQTTPQQWILQRELGEGVIEYYQYPMQITTNLSDAYCFTKARYAEHIMLNSPSFKEFKLRRLA